MDELITLAQLAELKVELNACRLKWKKLCKDREDMEDAMERFKKIENDLNSELDSMLSNMGVLLSESDNVRLTQNLYRFMKTKCRSPRYEAAVRDLERGKSQIRAKYNHNEDEIDAINQKIRRLENQIARLTKLLTN